MEQLTSTQPRLADYVRPLTSRWWMIVLAVVLATGGTYAFFAHKPNVYTAHTLVYVIDPGDPVTGVQNQQATDRQVQDQASLLDSRATAQAVGAQIGYRGTAADLLGRTSISSRPGEDFVEITAQGRSALEAASIANGFGREFVALVDGGFAARVINALHVSEQQLKRLGNSRNAELDRADLTTQINRLRLALGDHKTISKMVDAALPSGGPTSPKPLRNALFALVVSLALAIGVAYGFERFDRRLKSPDELERAYATPLLAVLPHTGKPSAVEGGAAALSSEFRESFRVLRTNIELAGLDNPPRTIVVTSATLGEGKSTVVRNLALAIRESGKTVAVVGLDLRRPSLTRMFGVVGGPGVTDVLRHRADLAQVSRDIPVGWPGVDELLGTTNGGRASDTTANGHNGNAAVRPGSGLTLVLGGVRPPNPPAVLASERLTEVLDELREVYDVVLIDSAPLLAVTDTVPLVRYADATLLVGRLGVTTRDTAKRVVEFLARVPKVRLLGVVANDLSRMDAESYGYGYGYGYGPSGDADTDTPAQDTAAGLSKQPA